ncbi:unnamed protein product [Caretta caretta]
MDAQGCNWQSEGEGQAHNKKLDLKGSVVTEEADIYVLIDGSTSIHPNDFGDIKNFLKEMVKMFNIGPNKVRFGAVQYSHVKRLEFELNEYNKTNDLETAIDNIRQIDGNTYIGEALTFMQPLFKKAREQRAGRVPCHLIVLTDGESHDSVKEPAESLRNEKVNIYAIGVKDANEGQLHEIAGSESRTFFVQEFDSLKNIKNEIVQVIRSEEACKETTADIMFLVDSSGSIGPENFLKVKNFMRELVNKSDISADRVQVGAVQFSGANKEEFQLDRYSSKSDIFSAIDRMSLIGENTLTGSALTFVADYFKPAKGARPAVKKILILITDGEAQDEVKSPARDLRDQGVVIYSIGVFNANKNQLEEISGKRELVFYVEKFDILKHIEDEIIFGICRPHEGSVVTEEADIYVLIDGSTSIHPNDFGDIKNFLKEMVKMFNIGPNKVRFGAVQYSHVKRLEFELNEYNKTNDLETAIDNIRQIDGNTYIGEALTFMQPLFKKAREQRAGRVPCHLIVLTDGESHDSVKEPAESLRNEKVNIYAIGVKDANEGQLHEIAGSESRTFFVQEFDSLKNIKNEIVQVIRSEEGENTLTGSALTFVADYFKPAKGARPAVKKILILITDGEAQDEVKSPARDLRDQGVVIYSIGVFNANKNQLEEISGKRELVFYVEKFDILKHIEDEIIFGICRPHEECKRIERLDVVFVIDGSGSISPLQYQAMKDFMIALVKKSDVAPDRVQFGAVKYSDEPETFFYLNKYTAKSEIVEAIQNDVTKGGSTYTAKAIDYSEALFAQEHGSRKSKGVPQILIVITDGESHDKAQLGDTAKRLRDNGIIIYAVGIEGAKLDELLAMTGSKDKYYYVDTFEGLKNTSIAISEKICDDSKPECEIQADLVFLIDGSNSIHPDDFTRMKNFLKDIINQIDYDHNVQIGIAQYSDRYKKEFGLGAFQSKSELNIQIQNIKRMTGTHTLIGAALRKVKEFFAPGGSRRVTRNVQPVLLVVTDGKSSDDVAEPAEDLRREGVHIYAIGVGYIDHSQLMQIAGVSERKYTVHDFNELKTIKKRLVDDLCKPDIPTSINE